MRTLLRSIITLMIISTPMLLAGCENAGVTVESLFVTPEFELLEPNTVLKRKCAARCPERRDACKNICTASHNSCKYRLKQAAHQQFLRYVDDQMAHGELVKKTEADFWDAEVEKNCARIPQCQARCDVGMRVCHSECGGTVIKGDMCYANCGNQRTPFDTQEEGWGLDSLL